MNVLSRIVGMKKLCVVLGGLGLLSTGAWAQDGGYSGQVGEGGAFLRRGKRAVWRVGHTAGPGIRG